MISVWLALFVLAIAALSAWVYALSNHKKLLATREEFEATLAALKQEIRSIQKINLGVGQTLLSVEKKLNHTIERQQQQLDLSASEYSFDHAATLAENGADAVEISKKFGMPQAEAELMSLMRKTKVAESHSVHE
jgi:hypothetical protein